MAIRHVSFTALPVEDQDRALRFYTEKLGFRVDADQPYGPDWRWIELAIEGARTHLVFTRPWPGAFGETPNLVLAVDDLAGTHRALVEKGVVFTRDPAPAEWSAESAYALFTDSEGNLVMLGEMADR